MSKRASLWILVVLAGGWYAAFEGRTSWIVLSCKAAPTLCDPSSLNALDRSVLINYDSSADFWSFVTQDLAGVLAVVAAIALGIKASRVGRFFDSFFTSMTLLLQATFANGLINECIRLWIQRPRPFVYLDPTGQGGAHSHYTSFYSGHTSFAAVATTCAWLAVRRANFSRMTQWSVATLGISLTAMTGALRVMAGRHFITDTVAGAFFGFLIAWSINRLHENRPSMR
ncbi:MAG: phosphatase PAP2 family protein [Oligoflexia bacterium]